MFKKRQRKVENEATTAAEKKAAEHKERQKHRDKILSYLNICYAQQALTTCRSDYILRKGGVVSRYLRHRGITQLCVYANQSDWSFARGVCWELSMSYDIDVRLWLTSDKTSKDIFLGQNMTARARFSRENLAKVHPNEPVLVLCSQITNQAIEKLRSQQAHVIMIEDILDDLYWENLYGSYVETIHDKFPQCPLVVLLRPLYPSNRQAYSEMERWTEENNIQHASSTILPKLQQPSATLPKILAGFNYSVDDVREMLMDPEYVNGSGKVVDNRMFCTDTQGKLVTVQGGVRRTSNVPENPQHKIFAVGQCELFGFGCPDDKTMPYFLQRDMLRNGYGDWAVENYGSFVFEKEKYQFETAYSLDAEPGDLIILELESRVYLPPKDAWLPEDCYILDQSKLFERPHDFGDNLHIDHDHLNEKGQEVWADQTYDWLAGNAIFEKAEQLSHIEGAAVQNRGAVDADMALPQERLSSSEQEQLSAYLSQLKEIKPKVGSIVMNCNPFTLVHRYLVEQAASQVDKLYIFVVEEDKSFFPFKDRMELVKKGVGDIPNVAVVPSGKFIISQTTFADYFGKESITEDKQIDASQDVEIFATQIAPALDINVRFAGTEPLDYVTSEYNKQMAEILPKYGVEFREIKRKADDTNVISASRVRAALKDKDFDAIAALVPRTTLDYLKERFGDRSAD
jgi:[citrate (pro-3S)-lyase] ligase